MPRACVARWIGWRNAKQGRRRAFDEQHLLLPQRSLCRSRRLLIRPTSDVPASVTVCASGVCRTRGLGSRHCIFVLAARTGWPCSRWGTSIRAWSVMTALAWRASAPMIHVRRAVEWLNLQQNSDGGWGESNTLMRCRLKIMSTAYQSAGVAALLAAGEVRSDARRGAEFDSGPESRWPVERPELYRTRISPGVLSAISRLFSVLPALGAGCLPHVDAPRNRSLNDRPLGVVAALVAEARTLGPAVRRRDGLLSLGNGALLAVSGMGADLAAPAARRLVEAGVSALLSFGLAGGLDPHSVPAGWCCPQSFPDGLACRPPNGAGICRAPTSRCGRHPPAVRGPWQWLKTRRCCFVKPALQRWDGESAIARGPRRTNLPFAAVRDRAAATLPRAVAAAGQGAVEHAASDRHCRGAPGSGRIDPLVATISGGDVLWQLSPVRHLA